MSDDFKPVLSGVTGISNCVTVGDHVLYLSSNKQPMTNGIIRTVTKITERTIVLDDGSIWNKYGYKYGSGITHINCWKKSVIADKPYIYHIYNLEKFKDYINKFSDKIVKSQERDNMLRYIFDKFKNPLEQCSYEEIKEVYDMIKNLEVLKALEDDSEED